MSGTNYSHIPPTDFQTVDTSYTSGSHKDEKDHISANVDERQPFSSTSDEGRQSQTGWQRTKFRVRTVSHKFWLLEASASIFSLIILAIILGTLKYYDDRYYGDTASTNPSKRPMLFPILAILGAFMRASMLLPVATAIGQLKWGWFRTGRRLIDMEKFDEAARGLLGSAKLIWALRFRNVAVVGAALTILTLPLDAVIQSAVLLPTTRRINKTIYPQYPNITDKTYMPRSTWYNDSQTMTNIDVRWPTTQMINAIRWGHSYNNGLSDLFDAVTKVSCPTGYCTFNKSQTLAVSSKCIDRTADIQTIPENTKNNTATYQTLPGTTLNFYYNGVRSGNTTYERQIIAAESWNGWPAKPYPGMNFDQRTLGPIILRTPMIVNWLEGSKYTAAEIASQTQAFECALYWYIRTETMYINETSSHKLSFDYEPMEFDIEYWNQTKKGNRLWTTSGNRWSLEPKRCFVEGKEIPKKINDTFYDDNCRFVVGEGAAQALENLVWDDTDGLQGVSYLKNSTLREWTRTNNFVTNLYATRGSSIKTMAERNLGSWNMTNSMWNNIAYGMSYTVRRSKSLMLNKTEPELLITTGTVLQPVYYWSIDWPRLAAPAFVVVFAAFFVLYTAIITRKEYAWRRSALPLLFHGLEDRERIALGDVRSFIAMQDVANKLQVRLDEHIDANGARFTTQN